MATEDFSALTLEEGGLRLTKDGGKAGFFRLRDQAWSPLSNAFPPLRPAALTNIQIDANHIRPVPTGWWVGGMAGLAWCATNGQAWDDFYEPPLLVRRSFWSGKINPGQKTHPGDRESMRIRDELAGQMQRRVGPPRPPGRLPGHVVALAPEGELLWVVTDAYGPGAPASRLLVLHVPSRRWVAAVTVPARVRALGVTRTHVWLGVDASPYEADGSPLWRYAKAPLLALPPNRWLPQAVSEA